MSKFQLDEIASFTSPLQLVDSVHFMEFVKCIEPQRHVSDWHFFACKAIPALHNPVEGNVASCNVLMTKDTCSSNYGQGCYVSFTGHGVKLLTARKEEGKGSLLELALPPGINTAGGDSARSVCSTFSF